MDHDTELRLPETRIRVPVPPLDLTFRAKKKFQKTLIYLTFEVIVQPLLHILFIIFFLFLAQ